MLIDLTSICSFHLISIRRYEKQSKESVKIKADLKVLRNDMLEMKKLMHNIANKIEQTRTQRQPSLTEQNPIQIRADLYRRK